MSGTGAGGGGAAATALHRSAGCQPCWPAVGEGGVFGPALREPHVVLGYRLAVSLRERGGAAGDQPLGVLDLSGQSGLVGLVGDEDPAVQAGAPLSQVRSGGSRHEPLGKKRSARSNRCRLSWSSRENCTRLPSALSLAALHT